MSDTEQAYVGLSLTANGFGYAGSLVSFEPPQISESTEDYRGGRIAPRKMMTGYEAVESKFKLSREDANISVLRAIIGTDVVLTVRAALDEKGKSVAVQWIIYGRIYKSESSEIKAGSVVDKTYTITVEKFVKAIDSIPAEAFDIATGELKFGTTDILANVKAQIGL